MCLKIGKKRAASDSKKKEEEELVLRCTDHWTCGGCLLDTWERNGKGKGSQKPAVSG